MATEDTVSTIAKALGESDEIPLGQIGGVMKILGEELCLKLLEETKQIDAKGGMMLPDNSRKRTLGGVFFFLARQKLSHEDKLAIFRAPKPAKPPGAPVSEGSPFPRRRVIDVAPARPVVPARPPRTGFVPPDLPVAVRRVKVKEAIQSSLTALPADDQYGLLLDLIAELHEKLGYRAPESTRGQAFDPPTRPGATLGGPPSSQRPIPVPESSRVAPESARHVTGAPPAVAPAEKPKRTATRAKRS